MTHPDFEAQLDAYLDGELEAADARELEAHIAQCSECAQFRNRRLALRAAIKAQLPPLAAPDVLRQRITPKRRFSVGWRSLALAASLAVVAVGGWQLGFQSGVGERLADAVLTTHIRSLMP